MKKTNGRMRPWRFACAWMLAAGLSACASAPEIPEGAERQMRTESNGDVIEEYRIGGLLRMVKITPARGVPYYLIDRNGDGRLEGHHGAIPPVYFKLYSW